MRYRIRKGDHIGSVASRLIVQAGHPQRDGMEKWSSRWPHKPEIAGSNPAPVTNIPSKGESVTTEEQPVSTKRMKGGQRIAGVTPQGLRLRVLDAIPTWEQWPRSLRKAALLFPTHGTDLDDLAEAVGISDEKMVSLFATDAGKAFNEVRVGYKMNGKYPEQQTPKKSTKRNPDKNAPRGQKRIEVLTPRGPLQHGDLVAQYANEMTVMALIQSEQTLKSNGMKIAEKAGWWENIETDTRKRRAVTDAKNEAFANRQGSDEDGINWNPDAIPLPRFNQDLEVTEDFEAVTASASG